MKCGTKKLESRGVSHDEETMIVGRTMWTQSMSVTDTWTDGQIDGQIYNDSIYFHSNEFEV